MTHSSSLETCALCSEMRSTEIRCNLFILLLDESRFFFFSSNFQLKWDRCAIVAHPTSYVSRHFVYWRKINRLISNCLCICRVYSNEIVIQIGWYACEARAMCVYSLDKCFIWRRLKSQPKIWICMKKSAWRRSNERGKKWNKTYSAEQTRSNCYRARSHQLVQLTRIWFESRAWIFWAQYAVRTVFPRSLALALASAFFHNPAPNSFHTLFLRHCNCHWVARRRNVFGYKKEYSVHFFPSVRIFPHPLAVVWAILCSAESAQPQTDRSHGVASNPWKSKETARMWSSIVVG